MAWRNLWRKFSLCDVSVSCHFHVCPSSVCVPLPCLCNARRMLMNEAYACSSLLSGKPTAGIFLKALWGSGRHPFEPDLGATSTPAWPARLLGLMGSKVSTPAQLLRDDALKCRKPNASGFLPVHRHLRVAALRFCLQYSSAMRDWDGLLTAGCRSPFCSSLLPFNFVCSLQSFFCGIKCTIVRQMFI